MEGRRAGGHKTRQVPVLLSCWLGPVLQGGLSILDIFQYFKIILFAKECCKSFFFLSPLQVPHADSAFSCKTCCNEDFFHNAAILDSTPKAWGVSSNCNFQGLGEGTSVNPEELH